MTRTVSFTYYDKILAAIAASLGAGMLLGVTTEYPFEIGLLGGSLIATVFVYDAIFRNPPRPAPTNRSKVAGVVWFVYLVFLLVSTIR